VFDSFAVLQFWKCGEDGGSQRSVKAIALAALDGFESLRFHQFRRNTMGELIIYLVISTISTFFQFALMGFAGMLGVQFARKIFK
jgi:hypothetical protein